MAYIRFPTTAALLAFPFQPRHVGREVYDVQTGDEYVVIANGAGAGVLELLNEGAGSLTYGTPGTIQPDDTAAGGAATSVARSDHRHAITAATAGTATPGDSAAEGSATSFARSDHKHALGAFGTASGTFCQGNDSRLSDDRTASGLRSASTVVSVSGATAPSSGQVLTATSSTAATWQAGSGFTASYYTGYSTTSGHAWDSVTWSDVHNKITITDVDQVGISRSNSTFTITATGIYVFDFLAMGHNTAGEDYWGVRYRRSSTTLAQFTTHANGSARTTHGQCRTVVSITASDAITIQYTVTAAYSGYTTGTVDGEIGRTAQINIYRIT